MKHIVVEGLPHHVPIRKENRWEAIQHYATAPNIAVAAVPMRQPDISELLMPERQESVSSYISQFSAQNRQSISCNSLLTTTSSREDDGDSYSFSPLPPRIPLSSMLRTSLIKTHECIPSLLSSPGSQNSKSTSKQQLSSNSLFSRNSLNTATIEKKEEEDTNAYRGYAMHLTNQMKSPPVARCPRAKGPSQLENWFQHSDGSSASHEENPIEPHSGRTSTIPVVHECIDETVGTNSTSDYYASETEGGTISEMTESSPGTGRAAAAAPPTANSIRQVLHDYASHSGNASKSSSDETTTSAETGSTRLDQLREKMRKLRERRALSFSQTSQSSNKIPENIKTRFQNPSLLSSSQSKYSPTSILKKKKLNMKKPSVSFSESTHSSKPIPMMIEQEPQNESNASSSSLESQSSFGSTAKTNTSSSSLESHSSFGSTAKTNKIRSNSHNNRKARPIQPPEAPTHVKTVSKGLKKNIQKEMTTEVSHHKKLLVPMTLFSIHQVTEEAAESLTVEMKNDANIPISTCTSSSSEEAAESLEITNSSSFASSKCASIAEEAVESLRAERLQLTSSSSVSSSSKCTPIAEEVPVVRQRKYDPHIHITRQYSMKQLAEELSPKSKRAGRRPGSSRLASKLERGSKRESSRSLTSKLETKSISEPKNLVDELKETLTERGPPVPNEEELQHPWSDPFPSDGIEPLASKDSLSTHSSPGSPPRSFRERYLMNIGDSEQSRTPQPFSTKNLVLGSLPQNMPAPDVYCPLQDEDESRGTKDSFSRENETKTSRSQSPKKWMTRKSVRKNMKKDVENAGQLSLGRNHKSWMPRKNEMRSRQATPLHESGHNNQNKPSWAQRSFVNRFPSSFKEKDDNKKSSFRRPSSGRPARSTSQSSKGKERDGSSTKSLSRHLVRSKSSKQLEKEREHLLRSIRNSSRDKTLSREPSSGSLVRRASNSSRDKSIKSLSKELSSRSLLRNASNSSRDKSIKSLSKTASSKRLLRNLSNSSRDKSIKSLSREPSSRSLYRNTSNSSRDKSIKSLSKDASSRRLLRKTSNSSKGPSSRRPARRSSKSSVDKETKGCSTKPSPRKPVRSASKSSVDKQKESGSRMPSSRRLIGQRDKNNKSYTQIDTTSTKKTSSGRFGSAIRKSSNENDNPQTPLSGRFGASRKSGKDKNSTKTPYSRRFSAKRFSSSSLSSKEKDCLATTKQQQHPSRRLVEVIDKRDDSYNSLGSSKTPSSRRAGLKSSRDHSHKSCTTVGSDQSGSSNNDSSSIHNISNHKADSPAKHGRRTRPRTPTSQRKSRHKDYRTNGVVSVEQKRFHVDMCGGIE